MLMMAFTLFKARVQMFSLGCRLETETFGCPSTVKLVVRIFLTAIAMDRLVADIRL